MDEEKLAEFRARLAQVRLGRPATADPVGAAIVYLADALVLGLEMIIEDV